MEKAKIDTMSATYLLQDEPIQSSANDPDNRDPNAMNKHLRLDFFNVIAEPDSSAYSFDALHRISHQVYHYSKVCIYRFLSIFLALPLMVCWGLIFGTYAFLMIWFVAPMRRLSQSAIAEAGIYVQTACDAIIAPLYRSAALLFSNVRISFTHKTIEAGKTVNV